MKQLGVAVVACCLPDEIIFDEILTRLPALHLVKLKCVSKLWCKTIVDPSFVKAHLHRWRSLPVGHLVGSIPNISFFNEITNEDVHLKFLNSISDIIPGKKTFIPIASCDGLLVLAVQQEEKKYWCPSYYICNPVTGYYMKLPSPPSPPKVCWRYAVFCCNDGYKIVAWDEDNEVVYLFGGDLEAGGHWRTFSLPEGEGLPSYTPASFNGCLHWLDVRKDVMISFDLACGEIRKTAVPYDDGREWYFRIVVFQGIFYLLQLHDVDFGPCCCCYVIWTLEDWEKQKWREVYKRKYEFCYICECEEISSCDGDLVFGKIYRNFIGTWGWYYWDENFPHFNSLVSLDACCSLAKHA